MLLVPNRPGICWLQKADETRHVPHFPQKVAPNPRIKGWVRPARHLGLGRENVASQGVFTEHRQCRHVNRTCRYPPRPAVGSAYEGKGARQRRGRARRAPTRRAPSRTHFCLYRRPIPADSFYEWTKSPTDGGKDPWHIFLPRASGVLVRRALGINKKLDITSGATIT